MGRRRSKRISMAGSIVPQKKTNTAGRPIQLGDNWTVGRRGANISRDNYGRRGGSVEWVLPRVENRRR